MCPVFKGGASGRPLPGLTVSMALAWEPTEMQVLCLDTARGDGSEEWSCAPFLMEAIVNSFLPNNSQSQGL